MQYTLVFPSRRPTLVQDVHSWLLHARLAILTWLIVVGFCLSCSNNLVWGQEVDAGNNMIVAAGFGYQIGPVSVIAVKVYDAESGAILSDEVYDLAVKENDGGGSTHGPRIFAGGVGLGATDLSNFMLRVYDANTGAFQWEGRLNLVHTDRKGEAQVISTRIPRRATVMKAQAVQPAAEQPVFLLRALDAATGLAVWEDEFTAAHIRIPRVQPIISRSNQPDGTFTGSSRTFDFRIRMYDPSGQDVRWEDQLSRLESDDGTTESSSDRASILPAWPQHPQEEEAPAESI
ncbi:MAG: hypothetical protein Nkreftii_001019 [Candidatus Nitrospira kreftii]|uniref:Uncharacterized protein n=1 Tax=Candidatus Nitrospira kreftii TaxID=2652173 RepID=A0A7S8FC97_9BACT|nr:MAG: hypothetical protein Nkreftii_001019 [Candidatus Nitrospira kreftii]